MSTPLEQLISLSHDLGREDRKLSILGEGNTSVRLSSETFLVKASGSSLATLRPQDVTECRFAPLIELLDRDQATDAEIDAALIASQVSPSAKKPSTEAMFHAYLLSLPGIQWIAHCHPIVVNGILCSPRAEDFATRRMFPDEIVCCGQQSILIPYTDPGLQLAKAIRAAVKSDAAPLPRVILLTNHGLITPAPTAGAALAATFMTVKAAEIFTRAAALGGPIFLTPGDNDRIESRNDEHYRRKQLGI
jgi:rhamnose utilization protein RhaD (predicted bifunctional aldolase and dehydrogenase)